MRDERGSLLLGCAGREESRWIAVKGAEHLERTNRAIRTCTSSVMEDQLMEMFNWREGTAGRNWRAIWRDGRASMTVSAFESMPEWPNRSTWLIAPHCRSIGRH
jgi:hypothetical protein